MATTPEDWCPSPDAPTAELPRMDLKTLCEHGWQRLLITGFLRDNLTRLFQPGNIRTQDLKSFIWRKNADESKILIESIYRWKAAHAGQRPAILVKPGAETNRRIAIGDIERYNRQGHVEFATYWIGSHTLFCIHGSGAGAEILAAEVKAHLVQFGYVFVHELGFARFQVVENGEIHELEEYKENFVIPITVGWAYPMKWSVARESLKLSRLPFTVLMDDHL